MKRYDVFLFGNVGCVSNFGFFMWRQTPNFGVELALF